MPADALPLVDVAEIIRLVGTAAFQRARAYARDGAVTAMDWDAEHGTLSSTVLGNASRPYRCRIDLIPGPKSFSKPAGSVCSCPVGGACKHIAATLLSSNAAAVHQFDSGAEHEAKHPLTLTSGATAPAEASWKTSISALRSPAEKPAISTLPVTTTPLALAFELREQTPRTQSRWRGPTARTAKPTATERANAQYRLGVRPVIKSSTGNWIKGNITWNTLSYQINRLGLDPEQLSWFAQFAALHRAGRDTYLGQDLDWLYLDDFQSSLLWILLADTDRLGIPLVGTKKNISVALASKAVIALDARAPTDAAIGADGASATGANPDGDLHLSPALSIDGIPHDPHRAGVIGNHGVYAYSLDSRTAVMIAPTSAPISAAQRSIIEHPTDVVIPATDVDEFITEFYPNLRTAVTFTSTDDSISFPEIAPPTLLLTATFMAKHVLRLSWEWEYHDTSPDRRMPLDAVPGEPGTRDPAVETRVRAEAHRILAGAGDAHPFETTALQGIAAAEFTEHVLPLLEALDGVRVHVVGIRPDYHELVAAPSFTITTVETEQRDWFDLGVIVTVDGKKIPFGPLFTALAKGQRKLLLVDNSYFSLAHPAFAQLRELIHEAESLQEWETGLRISRYQASLWEDFEDLADQTEEATAWRDTVSALRDLTTVEATPVPASVNATMRPYQTDGYNWLTFLWRHGLGGVLADDMGLGKTLQTLAMIANARETASDVPRAITAPFLVVAPTSVVSNWVNEAAKFTPDLVVHEVSSTHAKSGIRLKDAASGADIVVTSYTLFRLEFDDYQSQEWAGLVLDEAQFVKNRATRAHQAARDLNTPFKLAITGTPLENNLMELWSLFAIVAPGLFASPRKFTENYQRPIETAGNSELLAKLRRRIRPLMMRRTKELVATELPPKQEQVLQIDLNAKHRKLYDTFLQRERQKLLGLIDDLDKNRFIVFRSLTLLRMLSLDATLVDEKYSDVASSKLDALFEQLEDVLAEGHRALIFSQFTSFLQKAAERLDAQGVAYAYLDGSTRRRSEVIDRFKSGDAPVFLISLKAGGFGLNLTEADYVFMLDPWWNPASEAQAIDRTHRIGQTQNVMVYRMVAKGTIEEKVMALKEKKAKLFTSVMDDDAVFSSALTADDIRGLLSAE